MAQKLNITIDQGTTFSTSIEAKDTNGDPINFTGYTGASKMRKHYSSANSHSFTVVLSNNGIITLSMTANTTNNIVSGRYLYDIEVTSSSGDVSRIVEGIATINPSVTY